MGLRAKRDRRWRAVARLGAMVLCVFAAAGRGHANGPSVPAETTGLSAPEAAPEAWIETLAGGGPVGDGGPALKARLHLPGGVLGTADGDLIIVDFGHHRIRRVDHTTGEITTIAGTGEAGYNGDGIPASRARLSRPEFAALAPDGSLYVADSYNNRIRRIDFGTGLISTVAGSGEKGFSGDGGPATEAALHFPEGIAIDLQGHLYIGDMANRRIRRVDAATGIITTFAGTGEIGTSPDGTLATQAQFLRVARLATDAEGNLYIADSPSHTIQKIDVESGILHTVAGTGTPGDSGDGGPAREARIRFPEGLVVAKNGDVYFADAGNHRVRRIDVRSGTMEPVAGTGKHGFSGDGGPATEAQLWSPGRLGFDAGGLLICDIGNLRVRRVDRRTGRISTVAGSGDLGDGGPARDAMLSVPGDVAYRDGKLYVADYGHRRVRSVDLKTGVITTVAGGGARSGEGIPAVEAELVLPEGIAADENDLYIADNSANRVWRVDLKTGLLYRFAGTGEPGFAGDGGPAKEARLYLPGAVSIAPDGRVLIADYGNRRIRAVDPATGTIASLESPSRYLQAHLQRGVMSVEATSRGIYRIIAEKEAVVERLDLEHSVLEELSMGVSGDSRPQGESRIIDVAVYGSSMYVVDAFGHRVLCMDLDNGHVEVVAGSGTQGFSGDGGPALEASLFQPGGVAVGAYGQEIFIADAKNHRIRRVHLSPHS